MSLHVQLSEEAAAKLRSQKRISTVSSLAVSMLAIVLVGLSLGLFLLPTIKEDTPVIVAYKGSVAEKEKPQQQKTKSKVQKKPSAPAKTQNRVIATNSPSAVSIPTVDVSVDAEVLDFGAGNDFGGDWGGGVSMNSGGGATFFQQEVKAERIAFVIDYSASMRGVKDKLMREELSKSLSGLPPGAKYQLIFFSGPAWVGGDKVNLVPKAKVATVESGEGRRIYNWQSTGAHFWEPDGKKQKAEWLTMTSEQLRESLKIVKESKLNWGTDWTNPLEMAFDMDLKPQVVFFMTDGSTGGDMMKLTDKLGATAKRKGIIVNCVALMEPKAQKPMLNLAKKTGGVFTIVEKNGEVRQVDE